MAGATQSMLTDAMLKRFADRAPGYDRDNQFFEEDFTELKQAGYLTAAVPRELGGGGLTFAQMMHEQRRLAYYAHATALGINMHLYWTGVAADLWRAGHKSRCTQPGTPRRGTTFPCFCRRARPSRSRVDTVSPATSTSGA